MNLENIKSVCCKSVVISCAWGSSKFWKCGKCGKKCKISDKDKIQVPFYGHAQIVNAIKKNTK